MLLPLGSISSGWRSRFLVPLEDSLRFLRVHDEPLGISFFGSSTDHVHGVLKTVRVDGEKFVAILKRLVVILQRNIVVHVQTVGQDGIVSLLARPGGKLVNERKLLRRIGCGVDLRQCVVHFRPRLNRNVLSDLLAEDRAC